MWIVAYALRRPISIAAMAALMMLLGVVAFFTMPKDIFPAVDIPEVNVVWYYPGMSADLRFDGGEGLPFREGAAVSNDHRALHQRAVREPHRNASRRLALRHRGFECHRGSTCPSLKASVPELADRSRTILSRYGFVHFFVTEIDNVRGSVSVSASRVADLKASD
jgi:hypothetical protein